MAIILAILISPLITTLAAVTYAAILFPPVMMLLNQIHEFFTFIPALGWWEIFLCLALIGIFLMTSRQGGAS